MANKAKKRIKRATLRKTRQPGRVEKVQKSIDEIDYASYYTKAKHRLAKKDILTYPEYLTAREGEIARGRDFTPSSIVHRQVQYGYTDKEIEARWAAHKRLFPNDNLTRNQFVKAKGWDDIEYVAKIRIKQKMEEEGITEDEAKSLVWREIMSPEHDDEAKGEASE